MPPEKNQNTKVYISIDDGERIELPSIQSVTLSGDKKEDVKIASMNHSRGFSATSVEFRPTDDLTTEDLWLILCGVCTKKQITSNNWRRFHGMPMKRRRRKKNDVDSK